MYHSETVGLSTLLEVKSQKSMYAGSGKGTAP